MNRENPRWGAPRILGWLLQLGFDVSGASVSRYLRRLQLQGKPEKAKQRLTLLHNHREVIAAFGFFTVPTLSFRTLYCLFVIEHGRRRILAFNCTAHPTADWIVQQLRQAFSDPCPYRYVVFDRDAKFGKDVAQFLRSTGLRALRSRVRCSWQNGTAERLVQSARRDVMDHVIAINEQHLRRLAREYVTYYQVDRTHLGLEKSTPNNQPVETRSDDACQV
jgi:transposase InsO family protein